MRRAAPPFSEIALCGRMQECLCRCLAPLSHPTHTHTHTHTHTRLRSMASLAPHALAVLHPHAEFARACEEGAGSPASARAHPHADPAEAAASLSFQHFFARACSSGLAVVRDYQPSALLAFAEQALVLEQKLAAGCFLLQAVLLVEHFVRATPCLPADREPLAHEFGQSEAAWMRRSGCGTVHCGGVLIAMCVCVCVCVCVCASSL